MYESGTYDKSIMKNLYDVFDSPDVFDNINEYNTKARQFFQIVKNSGDFRNLKELYYWILPIYDEGDTMYNFKDEPYPKPYTDTFLEDLYQRYKQISSSDRLRKNKSLVSSRSEIADLLSVSKYNEDVNLYNNYINSDFNDNLFDTKPSEYTGPYTSLPPKI